jgi:sugar lactone lactonase YvrE
VYISDYGNNRVRKITASTGIITTYAGSGSASFSGDGGVASSAALHNPCGLCIDSAGITPPPLSILILNSSLPGNLYIADEANNRIRKITVSSNEITTIAGIGSTTFSGDNGPATSATLSRPVGIALDASGNVYVGDGYNHRIRKVTIASGIIGTIAGTGVQGYSGDGGAATAAMIQQPEGVALDSLGNVYFGDYGSYNVIRKVTVATGIISTFAGTGSTTGGYNGDNIQATAATLNSPDGLVLDSYGDMYIADRFNNRIRKVDGSTGVITTVVGTGDASSSGDGSVATSATINGPCFSTLDGSGNLYIAECQGYRVRKVTIVSTDIPTAAPSRTPR